MQELLAIQNLSVEIQSDEGLIRPVRDVSFTVHKGEVLAIVGESGCGKSMLVKSIMGLLPKSAKITSGNITACHTGALQFSMVLQDPMSSLNPTITIGKQIEEAVAVHNRGLNKKELHKKSIELMELVGIEKAEERSMLYPHDFSGGMRQRAVLAIALASDPEILIADEPTTSLDVTIQAQILDLLKNIQHKLQMTTILVSHDLGVVASIADRVAIMYAGKIVEIGTADEIYYDPRHPYTWGLMRSLPSFAKKNDSLYTIPGMPPNMMNLPNGDVFAERNDYAMKIDYEKEPPFFKITDTHYAATWLLDPRAPEVDNPIRDKEHIIAAVKEKNHHTHTHTHSHLKDAEKGEYILDIQHLSHSFPITKKTAFKAVNDVSFKMKRGEILGIVGESGSGKSTIARCIMNIYQASSGTIIFDGINICNKKELKENRKRLSKERQIIFQDSASSLNPRMKAADIITEPLKINHITTSRKSYREEAKFQLKYVGMDKEYLNKYPGEMSGGQRQRIAIARALSMEPELLVADEPIASLDVSIQAQIVNLFKHLQEEHGFSILFIAHDLSMVRYLCDRVGVLYKGRLVELGDTDKIYGNPLHPYTKLLMDGIPVPDPRLERKRKTNYYENMAFSLEGEMTEMESGHFVLGDF